MFFEQIATITRDHANTHLRANLDAINGLFTADPVRLVLPKSFEVSSLVGGVAGIAGRETLPALAIAANSKQVDQSQNSEDLNLFIYSGQIIGMVAADNAADVEKIAWRYAAAVELFVREHHFRPWSTSLNIGDLPFLITEFVFLSSTPMGAAAVQDQVGKVKMWVDGFRIDLFWRVSEGGTGQHDA